MIVVNSSDVKAVKHVKGEGSVVEGANYRQLLIDEKTSGGFGVAIVKFDPGTKLAFHTHPTEQILYVTDGKGIIATRNEEYIVTPGMVVFIPPGEVHSHGAAKDSSFSHLAIGRGEPKVVK